MKNIDHYGHWYNEDDKKYIIPRERVSLEFMKKLKLKKNSFILDAGCGDGRFTEFIIKQFGINVKGLEYSKEGLEICKKKKIDVKFADFNFFINSNDTLSRGIMYFLSSSLYQ